MLTYDWNRKAYVDDDGNDMSDEEAITEIRGMGQTIYESKDDTGGDDYDKKKKGSRASKVAGNIIKGGLAVTAVTLGDDVTGAGVVDDVAIPFELAGTAIVAGIAWTGDTIYDAIKDHTEDGVTTKPQDEYVILFRGVYEGHPDYLNALQGQATPIGGHADPRAHNLGNNSSIYTSWTVNPYVANSFATKGGKQNGGIVLMKRFHISELQASPDFFIKEKYLLEVL
jgi:hypothetical protein